MLFFSSIKNHVLFLQQYASTHQVIAVIFVIYLILLFVKILNIPNTFF